MATISRQQYNDLYGPTVGDKIRLGDTDLYVEITKDLCVYGDEVVYGGGKTLRDGMGLANTTTSEGGTLDLVITNVTIIDPILGVIKADVGVKDGKIAGIGKAGNPNIMRGVTPELVTGAATDAISGEHLILTAAAIDGHVHSHYACRWWCRTDRRYQRYDYYFRYLEYETDVTIHRWPACKLRFSGQR